MFGKLAIVAAPLFYSAILAVPANAQVTPMPGAKAFVQQCGACHSLKPGERRLGPSLFQIVGKPAGKVEGFRYSAALRSSQLRWDRKTLDKWLTDSRAMVPGSSMFYRQADAQKRKAVLDYLESQMPNKK